MHKPPPISFPSPGFQEMYEQLAKVRDEQEAAARPGGQDWANGSAGGRRRIILVSRRLPYMLQV